MPGGRFSNSGTEILAFNTALASLLPSHNSNAAHHCLSYNAVSVRYSSRIAFILYVCSFSLDKTKHHKKCTKYTSRQKILFSEFRSSVSLLILLYLTFMSRNLVSFYRNDLCFQAMVSVSSKTKRLPFPPCGTSTGLKSQEELYEWITVILEIWL
jgi:hypothetical protein